MLEDILQGNKGEISEIFHSCTGTERKIFLTVGDGVWRSDVLVQVKREAVQIQELG